MTRGKGSSSRPARSAGNAEAEIATWLEIVDELYRSEGEADALEQWLESLAAALGADGCRLLRPGSGPATDGDEGAQWVDLGGGEEAAAIGVVRRRRLTIAERKRLASLAPHIRRVAALPARIDSALLPAALDRLSLAVLLVGSEGELLHANRAGQKILEDGAGIVFLDERIRLDSREATASFEELRSTSSGEPRSRPAARFTVPRPDRQPLEVMAVSLATGEPGERGSIALFVSDPESGVGTPPSVLRELYGLSRREADVVEQILLGRPLDEAARALGIHLETVRMHLKQVFQKVGTRRQVDLVRLLLSGVSNLSWE